MTLLTNMTQRIRVAGRITAINLRGQADFRADFIASILDGALWQTSVVVFASVLLVQFPSIGTVGSYPLTILPVLVQLVLTYLIPIAFIAYLPAAAISGNLDITGVPAILAYCSPLIGVFAYAVSRWVWAICLDHYQGANS